LFNARGELHHPAAMLLGVAPIAIDLRALGIGAPGCVLRVDPLTSLSTSFAPRGAGGLQGGVARVPFHIPVDANLLGARFRTQFVQIGWPLYTSNALDCTIASTLPRLGVSTVQANLNEGVVPATGRVNSWKAPVIRFRL
jgi:hypothetical protein